MRSRSSWNFYDGNFSSMMEISKNKKEKLRKNQKQREMPARESDYKRTAPSINKDSPKYIDRDHSMGKTGNAKKGTDAAHILSCGLVNAIVTHSPGQPRSDQSKATIAKKLNDESNLRIKSCYGNRELDERRDARIAQAVLNDTALSQGTTIRRAAQAYNASKSLGKELNSVTQALGDLKVYNEDTNRCHKLKNHSKHSK